jgi:hypothetical protein
VGKQVATMPLHGMHAFWRCRTGKPEFVWLTGAPPRRLHRCRSGQGRPRHPHSGDRLDRRSRQVRICLCNSAPGWRQYSQVRNMHSRSTATPRGARRCSEPPRYRSCHVAAPARDRSRRSGQAADRRRAGTARSHSGRDRGHSCVSGMLGDRPAIVVHGRSDVLIQPNHTARSYYGRNKSVDGAAAGCATTR